MDEKKYDIRAEEIVGSAIGDNPTVNNYFPSSSFPKLSEEERRALLQEYRAHLRRRYAELNLRGLPLLPGVRMPIDRVYIRLRARPREKRERPPDERALAEYVRRQQEQRRKWEKEARRAEAIAQDGAVEAQVRVQAARALGEMGRVEEAVLILRTIAKDKEVDEWTRHQAAKVLRRWGYVP